MAPEQQPKKKKNVVKVINTKGEQKLVYSVPHCTSDYLRALYDPFGTPTGVCIPSGEYPLDSFKVKVWTKGTLRLGTSGIGFISMCPPRANNASTVKYSTATSVGDQNTLFGAFTNTNVANFLDIPYSNADFSGGLVYARTVSAGMRIAYRGKLMDMNGVVVTFEHRDHADTMSYNFNTLSENPSSLKTPITTSHKEWQSNVCYSGPAIPGETDFNNVATLSTGAFMILAISGLAGDLYEFEVCQHLEFIGPKATAATTVSHTDAQGTGQVLQAVKTVSRERPLATQDGPSLWTKFKESVASTLPKLVNTVAGALPGSLGNLAKFATMVVPQGGHNPFIQNGFSKPLSLLGSSHYDAPSRMAEMPVITNDNFSRGLMPWTRDENHHVQDNLLSRYHSIDEILEDEEAMLLIMDLFLRLKRDRASRENPLSPTDSPSQRTSLELRKKSSQTNL